MSNAMRSGKRALAGVAAGALALGMMSIAGAGTATAAKSIKPKATGAGTATPVRAGTYGTIPNAVIAFTGTSVPSLSSDDTLYGYLTTATGTMYVDDSAAVQASSDDSMALGRTLVTNQTGGVNSNFFGVTSTDDSFFTFAVTTAGNYVGGLGNGTDTVTFNFTTSGNPASMTLTPATQTVTVGASAEMVVTIKDSTGAVTQPANLDTIGLSDNSDDTIVATDGASDNTAITQLAASGFAEGTGYFYLRTFGNAAGTTTVTATPQGTLVSLGLTAQTATVTKSGTVVGDDSAINVYASAPTNANQSPSVASGASANRSIAVPAGTTTVTLAIDDTTGNAAGSTLRFSAQLGGNGVLGTVNGVSTQVTPLIVEATTDSSRKASLTFTLGSNALVNGATLTVTQINVLNESLGGSGTVITQQTPVVYPADVTVSPSGDAIAKLGESTAVTVTVDDSFGTPQAGWTVNAYRTSTAGALLSTAQTNASGSAQVTVSPLGTVVNNGTETYVFTAISPLGTSAGTLDNLVVTYTTSGVITSMTVAASGTGSTAFSNAAPTITTAPLAYVPSAGVVTAAGNGAFTVSTGLQSTAPTAGGSYVTFQANTTPGNAVTVTVPEGAKVATAATLPGAADTAGWSGGAQTVTVPDNTVVYVWATKTGVHDVTFESGGISLTGKFKAINTPADAYNIALSPATQTLGTGAFGTVTVKVTDVFGNTVAGTSDDTGGVTVSATGEVRLGGFQSSQAVNTDTNGEATVTVIAGNTAGTGALAAVPTNGTATSNAPAFRPVYTPPTGAPAPVTSAAATVAVTAAVTKSISIVGSRTTVSGKPGISIVGVTQGIEDGKTVIPYFRFPGQTTYTQGSARPEITDGEFVWQRKTGKKFYAYVTNDDGAVKSNRVIIPAN